MVFGVLKNDLTLIPRHLDNIFPGGTLFRLFERFDDPLREPDKRIVLPVHVIQKNARLPVRLQIPINNAADRVDRKLPG